LFGAIIYLTQERIPEVEERPAEEMGQAEGQAEGQADGQTVGQALLGQCFRIVGGEMETKDADQMSIRTSLFLPTQKMPGNQQCMPLDPPMSRMLIPRHAHY
jgi:sensor histidine kinase regulating citrate/malate metabolism